MSATVSTLAPRRGASRSSDPRRDPVPEGTNLVLLRGTIRRDPVERVLPSGDALLSFDLTVRPPDDVAASVPVVWFDPPAAAARFVEGTEVVVVGRIRRRFFRAGGATASRTEVTAERVIACSAATRVATTVRSALVDLAVD